MEFRDWCVNWSMDGHMPFNVSGQARINYFEGFSGDYKYSLEFTGSGTIEAHNPFPFKIPLHITHMTKGDLHPVTEISVGNHNTVVDPRVRFPGNVNIVKQIGWAETGKNVIDIRPTMLSHLPFRVTSIIMCGSCSDIVGYIDEELKCLVNPYHFLCERGT